MEKIKELYVIIEDRPNSAGDLFRILKKKNISVYAVGIFQDTARLYVSDPQKTVATLHANNYVVEERDVLRLSLPNRQGALMELTMKLGKAGINIDYLYGALEPKQKKGTIILEVDQPELALQIFRNHEF
ncbi:MAG: hypothetical protein EH225_09440 [Calditrichaeota bacterium]|nr:hypothetical protein [Calditrichota bacterium]RQW01595.1 MAG: hypothetical protein EH225_09440 [Calditrichota bacterium]